MLLIALLFLGASEIYVAASAQTAYIYADPSEVNATGKPADYQFPVDINVTEAPTTYAWEVHVTWDPSLLDLFLVSEGDFLKRPPTNYETTFTTYPVAVAEASQWGNITVGCSLKGDVTWATGDGWLFRLGFRVKAGALGSTPINLSSTVLLDRLEAGSPAPTSYPNLDSFFFNTQFHDIAVTDTVASPTTVRAEETVSINVTIANKGNFTETSDVAVYADIVARDPVNLDTILIGDEITVGTQTVTDLGPGATTTLRFTWNTTGVEDGNYTISAKSFLSDDNPGDNIFFDGVITVKPPALRHDIAIISVVPSPTDVRVGDSVTISIEVKNEGNFSETFSITVYADLNTTVLGDEITVGTKNDVSLTNGTSTTSTITWDTSGVSAGIYTISAKVPPVASEREVDKADNTKVDSTVKVQTVSSGTDYTWYIVGIVVVIAVVAVVLYFFRFRKR